MEAKDVEVFVSYKSGEVHSIRLFAEHLLACGFKVWIDEYAINVNKRSQFKEEIRDAISRSSHFIFFSGEQYFGSDYCLYELSCAKNNSDVWPRNTLEIQYKDLIQNPNDDDARQHSVLNHPTDFTDEAVCRRLWPKLSKFFGVDIYFDPPQFKAQRLSTIDQQFTVGELSFSLFAVGWLLQNKNKALKPKFTGRLRSAVFHSCFTSKRIKCEVNVKLIGSKEGFVYSHGLARFEKFIELTRPVLNKNSNCRGAHLVIIDGNTHVAFTHEPRKNYLVREYAVFTGKTLSKDDVYLSFEFHFFGDFRSFCKSTRYMDDLVYSINFL